MFRARVLESSLANAAIQRSLAVEGSLVGRLGETELGVCRYVSQNQSSDWRHDSLRIRSKAKLNAGIWPPTRRVLAAFVRTYTASFAESSMVAVWGPSLRGESEFLLDWTRQSTILIPLETLDPVSLAATGLEPWSVGLEGRNVLVVAPFAPVAVEQSKRAKRLFASDTRILPTCRIIGIEPPQTQALQVSTRSWTQALDALKFRVDRLQRHADVALVAAGSYGMPIASHLQGLGIPTIYVGGCLQLLFGIAGKRWMADPAIRRLMTSNWVRPTRTGSPLGACLVEGGAYW